MDRPAPFPHFLTSGKALTSIKQKDFLIEKAFYSVHEYLTLDSIEHN
jgi:hypothetical protein